MDSSSKQTTDSEWQPKVIKEDVKQIYKVWFFSVLSFLSSSFIQCLYLHRFPIMFWIISWWSLTAWLCTGIVNQSHTQAMTRLRCWSVEPYSIGWHAVKCIIHAYSFLQLQNVLKGNIANPHNTTKYKYCELMKLLPLMVWLCLRLMLSSNMDTFCVFPQWLSPLLPKLISDCTLNQNWTNFLWPKFCWTWSWMKLPLLSTSTRSETPPNVTMC